MLIYYAGVKGVPSEQTDAARIDGASERHLITKIILPQLKPIIRINVTPVSYTHLQYVNGDQHTAEADPGGSQGAGAGRI